MPFTGSTRATTPTTHASAGQPSRTAARPSGAGSAGATAFGISARRPSGTPRPRT